MFGQNKKKFSNKKQFSRGKVFKKKVNRREDEVFRGDEDLSNVDEEKIHEENDDAKRMMKERERNYKKFLIEQGKSAPTTWESFSDDEKDVAASSTESPEEKSLKETPSKEKKGKKRNLHEEENQRINVKKSKTADGGANSLSSSPTNPEEEGSPKETLAKKTENKNSQEKKRKPEKKSKKDSGDKMQKIKAKLKAKYDNDKWGEATTSPQSQEATPGKSTQRCLGCRKMGHLLKDCREFDKKSGDICLKCGSSEHKYRSCPVQRGPKFAFATCFKCKEMGHISKQCPKNSNGIYPDGGSCNQCQGVDHLARDCPKNRHRGGRKRNTKDSKKYFRVNRRKN
uniref:Putative e3 ubiquitin ligase n=1 Tax=Lutzomyia longipalpis TaxID=7200 RepID=A0A1B0CV11_LUTLO